MSVSLANASEHFFKAVSTRDKSAFISCFEENQFLGALLPNGDFFADFHNFIDSQDAWFYGQTGLFEHQFINADSKGIIGRTISKIRYSQDTEKVSNIMISLIFVRIKNEWRSVYIQNSLL